MEYWAVTGADRQIVAWDWVIEELGKSIRRPEVVILNVCYSADIEQAVCDLGVEFVITIAGAVSDLCAHEFSAALYRALRDRSLGRAIEQATSAIRAKCPTTNYQIHPPGAADWFAPWTVAARH